MVLRKPTTLWMHNICRSRKLLRLCASYAIFISYKDSDFQVSMGKLIAQSGHMVKHYHADNGRFSDNGSIDAINEKYQNITLCGVRSHHQNGIYEKQSYARS